MKDNNTNRSLQPLTIVETTATVIEKSEEDRLRESIDAAMRVRMAFGKTDIEAACEIAEDMHKNNLTLTHWRFELDMYGQKGLQETVDKFSSY